MEFPCAIPIHDDGYLFSFAFFLSRQSFSKIAKRCAEAWNPESKSIAELAELRVYLIFRNVIYVSSEKQYILRSIYFYF